MNVFNQLKAVYDWVNPFLDIFILAFLLYSIYGILVKTQAAQLFKGIVTLFMIYAAAFVLNLETLLWILNALAPGLVVGVAIIFQPELRKIFLKIGQSDLFTIGKRSKRSYIDAVVSSAEKLSSYKRGMLVVFIRKNTLKDIVERTGVSPEGLRSHLHFWHMDLVLERAGIDGEVGEGVDLRRARKRMKTVAAKYAGAIESLRDNPRPLARVAAEYGFNPETFRDYVRKHEPELAGSRGMTVGANGHRVARRCVEKYAEAVRLYAATAEPLKSIAARLGLVYNSVGGYVRRHCPDAIRSHVPAARCGCLLADGQGAGCGVENQRAVLGRHDPERRAGSGARAEVHA